MKPRRVDLVVHYQTQMQVKTHPEDGWSLCGGNVKNLALLTVRFPDIPNCRYCLEMLTWETHGKLSNPAELRQMYDILMRGSEL